MSHQLPSEFIATKQAGKAHTPEQLHDFIQGFVNQKIPDYQMTAWLMSVYYEGMNDEETAALTEAMIASGKRLNYDVDVPLGDKHSTGGVGDKITLILAPLLAAAGIAVPTITGRGLGHTGGTLDKLESLPGFRTDLSVEAMQAQVKKLRLAFGAQTDDIVPADRRIYALRDVTSTVRSMPLITSSILSKKVAEGIDAIVFDVKCGSGAFMRNDEEALQLSQWLTRTASRFGLRSAALVTSMNHPLGETVGNWLETDECLRALRGEGVEQDIRDLTLALGGALLALLGKSATPAEGISQLDSHWSSGSAFERFSKVAVEQGARPENLESGAIPHPAKFEVVLKADRDGVFERIDALEVGLAGVALGAGRRSAEDDIDASAGFRLIAKPGAALKNGDPLVAVLGTEEARCVEIAKRISRAVRWAEGEFEPEPLIHTCVIDGEERPWKEVLNADDLGKK